MAPSTKPLVMISCTPVYGHLMPIRVIAKDLVARGFEVTFVTGSPYKSIMEEIGCSFVPLEGYSDYTEKDFEDLPFSKRKTLEGMEKFCHDLITIFVQSITTQHEAQQRALQKLTTDHPGRPIVSVNESFFMGYTPNCIDARGLKPTATIGVGIVPITLSSIDTAPFGPGLPPSSTPEGRQQNIAMTKSIQEDGLGSAQKLYEDILTDLGVTAAKIPFFLDAPFTLPDRFLQMCSPSAEYPRSDAPSSIRYAGGLPKGQRDPFVNPPAWWAPDVLRNTTKKIILVSQGTVAINFNDLIIPAMAGLASSADTLVVVALGSKGAVLPEGTVVPENARVADFIPFDELLPYCAVFVTNGGYGAFQHAIANGVPLVIAGDSEDKPEVAARAEWAGVGINLKTGKPTKEALAQGVKDVLADTKYKKRAVELKDEMKSFDPMGVLADSIEELGAVGQ